MTLKAEFTKLDTEHWNGIIALASKAENAEDLNDIINELEDVGLFNFDLATVCEKIEEAVTQWENVLEEVVEGDDWNFPAEWEDYDTYAMFGPDKIFKKDDNTIIVWDDLNGGYIECKRRDPIAED